MPPVTLEDVPLGITDGTATQILRGDLEAAQAVLVGIDSGVPTPPTGPGREFRL